MQLLVSDALLAIACLKKPNGKLIVAGDHMVSASYMPAYAYVHTVDRYLTFLKKNISIL